MVMMKKYVLLSTVVAAVVLAGCGSRITATGGDAARLGSKAISYSDFNREVRALVSNPEIAPSLTENGEPTAGFLASWMQNDVQELALGEIANERNITISDSDRAKARTAAASQFAAPGSPDGAGEAVFGQFPEWFQLLFVERQARQEVLLKSYEVTDAQAFFEANKERLLANCSSGKTLRHLVVSSPTQAAELLDQLAKGGDFVALVSKYSIDSSTKTTGGQLGCYSPGYFIQQFDDAVKPLAVGQRSGVIKTDFGYHIVEAMPVSYESLSATVADEMRTEAGKQLLSDINALIAREKAWVNPRIGTASISEAGFSVAAPAGSGASTPAPASSMIRTMPATKPSSVKQ
jgi:foldase protein PrsA